MCAAIAGPAITLEARPLGFNRPVQHDVVSPQAETAIAAACPGAKVAAWKGAPAVDPYWGPYHRIVTGFATDREVRFKGSSGGAVTGLALHALRTGLVDRVVHVLADPADPSGAAVVVSDDPARVLDGAGSRYVASSPLAAIGNVLADGGAVAFIGKPCDVSALRRLATVDDRVDAHVRLMLAFFCAGIPSRRAVRRVLERLDVRPEELAAFRYRGDGWPGKASATTSDGRLSQMTYEESWGGYLSKDVQFRCKICPDAVGGVADIACADAWYGGETGYPTFEELEGRSLIMTRTARGDAFLAAAAAAGVVETEPLALSEIDLMQPSQARRKRLVWGRVTALTATLRPTPDFTGVMVGAAAGRASPLEQAKNFLGSVRRSVRWIIGGRQ